MGIGVFCLIQAFVTMDLGNDSNRWTETRGKIVSVKAGKGGHVTHLTSGTLYYTYTSHGRSITSNCVTFGPLNLIVFDTNLLGWASGKEASDAENSYVKRGSIPVYYKPEDPQTSCLVRGYSVGWLIAYVIVGLSLIGATGYLFYKSRKPPPPEKVEYLKTPLTRR
jgi:hypothetical protein